VREVADRRHAGVVRLGFDAASATQVRLDESPADASCSLDGRTLRFHVPPRALRSVLLV
jgi:hypothetical protein